MLIPRYYQEEGSTISADFLKSKGKGHEIGVYPTGSGKSLIVAETIRKLGDATLVLQPSKEILEQNLAKYLAYGFEASAYSASVGQKVISQATFGTIGSVINQVDLFKHFRYIIIDECHGVNAKQGMYKNFIEQLDKVKVLGLTATPYRLNSSMGGSMLKFLTRTKPKIFSEVNYYVQTKTLFDEGYLCPVKYFDMRPYLEFDRKKLIANSSGAEFDDAAMKNYMDMINFMPMLVKSLTRLMEIRKGIVCFVRFTDQAFEVASHFGDQAAVVTAETPKRERERLITEWREGKIKMLVNVGILTTGIDYPELDTVVMARATMSLALYYQILGRGIRIHPNKPETWFVDFCDNISTFGKVEDLHLGRNKKGLWEITSNGRPLTNTILTV